MRCILTILLFYSQVCAAQSFYYPNLNKQAKNLTTIIPERWKAIDTAYGDLNNDELDDMAIVLEYNLPITENRAYGDNETDLIKEFQKPRVLAIYFKDTKTGKYVLAHQNNNFILRTNEGGLMGDPLKKMGITNNSLNLAFEGGANWRWKLNYQFKYQHKDWVLLQANNVYYNVTSGEVNEKLYDFANRRMKQTTGNLFTRNIASKVFEDTLIFSELRTLNTFKKPWTWEITKDNFL